MYVFFCVPQGYNQHGRVVLDGFSGIADAEVEAAEALARQKEVRSSWVALPDLALPTPVQLQMLPSKLTAEGAAEEVSMHISRDLEI